MKKPELTDFYDSSDPRGCSTSEYNQWVEALHEWKISEKKKKKKK